MQRLIRLALVLIGLPVLSAAYCHPMTEPSEREERDNVEVTLRHSAYSSVGQFVGVYILPKEYFWDEAEVPLFRGDEWQITLSNLKARHHPITFLIAQLNSGSSNSGSSYFVRGEVTCVYRRTKGNLRRVVEVEARIQHDGHTEKTVWKGSCRDW